MNIRFVGGLLSAYYLSGKEVWKSVLLHYFSSAAFVAIFFNGDEHGLMEMK